MEPYRSYSEGRGYPDDRGYPEEPAYSEPRSPEPGYAEAQGWYGERRGGDAPPPERTYEEPRRDYSRPPDPPRVDAATPPPRSVPPPEEPPGRRYPLPPPASPGPIGSVSGNPVSDGVYRSRRPATALLLGIPAAVLEVPALLLLADGAFGDPVSPAAVVAGSCLVLALPLLALGLYAVATGAVRAAGPNSAQAWLRPPVAYLSVALVLLISAGLAA